MIDASLWQRVADTHLARRMRAFVAAREATDT
jgi:hypothetical protein